MRLYQRAACLCGLLFSIVAFGGPVTNLIQNSGFETGAANWTFTGSAYVDTHDPGLARTGMFMGFVNSFAPAMGTISQDVPTTPGQDYYVEFWLAQNGSANASVDVTFDGVSIASLYVDGAIPVGPNYQKFSGTVKASSSVSEFVFSAHTVNQTIFLEDVLVSAVVPEPGTLALLAFGLVGLGYSRRKQ